MKLASWVSFALALIVAGPVWAATDGSSTLQIEDSGRPAKKFEEDKRITDIELKAQAGSLSPLSLKFDLSYQGPPVNDLADPNMPNPDNRARPNRTSLSGYTGLRYRLSSNSAVNASTGLRWYTPYQQVANEDTAKPTGEQDYELSNPQLSYDRTYPLGLTQMRSSFKVSYVTQDYYQNRGQYSGLGYKQSIKYTPLDGPVTLGMSVDTDWFLYKREYARADGRVSNYFLTFIPSFEYKILDNLNFKTSVGYSYANLRAKGSGWKWAEQIPMARAGFGWSITREIYFYPYLNFFTKRPAIDTTSLSFSTVFSVF